MPYTPATLKVSVAAQLGKTDGATPNTVRDTAINDARREVYSLNQWNFAKKVATVTWTDQGTFPFPALYTPEFDLGRMYVPDPSAPQGQWVFTEVPLEDIPTLIENDTSSMVFAVDYEKSQFLSNWTLNSPVTKFSYRQMPADLPLDGSLDSVPEIATPAAFAAIRLLSIANYWLAAERDEQNYDRFYRRFQSAFAQAQSLDNKSGPLASVPNRNDSLNLGFNVGGYDGV